MVTLDRPQMTIWRMRISRWVPKATTHKLRICNTAFRFNHGCTNTPQCCFIRTLPVLFFFLSWSKHFIVKYTWTA